MAFPPKICYNILKRNGGKKMQEFLKEILKEFDIEFFGFCPFSALEQGLFNNAAAKRLPANSKTVITFLFPYKVNEKRPKNISRYAAVADYHLVCGEMLKSIANLLKKRYQNFDFVPFIDNSPINEVKAAVLSGLGVVGKNKLLINKKYGSYCFIGEIITDCEIQSVNILNTDCINCGACINSCPSGFLGDKNNKCLSAITQQKVPLNEKEKLLIKNSGVIWGCDVCQQVCPMNKTVVTTPIKQFISSYRDEYIKGEDINKRAYEWRGEKVILRNYEL